MYSMDYRLAKELADRHLGQAARQAEAQLLAELSNSEESVASMSWQRRLMGRISLFLVTLGGRLVYYGLQPYRPMTVEADRQASGT